MLAPHGWKSKLSPRRGFTVVQAHWESQPPVVVAVRGVTESVGLVEVAFDEAMSRSIDLVVLDLGQDSLRERLLRSQGTDPGEIRLRGLLGASHVRVIRSEKAEHDEVETALDYCESNEPALLVVSTDFVADAVTDPSLRDRIFSERFDLLVVTHHDSS